VGGERQAAVIMCSCCHLLCAAAVLAQPCCAVAPSTLPTLCLGSVCLQTLLLQNKFDWSEYAQDGRVMLRWVAAEAAAGVVAIPPWAPQPCTASSGWRLLASLTALATFPPPPRCSYGPCQFPTLGLIVQRAWEIQAHVSEDFWYIQASAAAVVME